MAAGCGTFRSGARFGPYEILRLLGINLGEVYLVSDTRYGRNAALKVFSTSHFSAAELEKIKRDWERVECVAKVLDNHPNISAVYEVGSWNGWLFMAMEYFEGRGLREHSKGRPLSVAAAEKYAWEIALVLAVAHEHGLMHGHLYPSNVFITAEDHVKVLGFGDPTGHGLSSSALGYMAPEQILSEEWDQRADIFAFGAILYEMLSGACAFQRDSPSETVSAILQSTPQPLSHLNPQVPQRLESLVRRCLARNRTERFQSGQDLVLELGRPPARG